MCFSVYGSLCLFSPGVTVPMLWFGNSVASFGAGGGLERCTGSTLHFKKAWIRHRDKLRAGSRPRPHFIVNLIRKLRLHDTLVHFLSVRSLQTSKSRSSYPVAKKHAASAISLFKSSEYRTGPTGGRKRAGEGNQAMLCGPTLTSVTVIRARPPPV